MALNTHLWLAGPRYNFKLDHASGPRYNFKLDCASHLLYASGSLRLDHAFCTRSHLLHASGLRNNLHMDHASCARSHLPYALGSRNNMRLYHAFCTKNHLLHASGPRNNLHMDHASCTGSHVPYVLGDTQVQENVVYDLEDFIGGDYFTVSDEELRVEVERRKIAAANNDRGDFKAHDIKKPEDFLNGGHLKTHDIKKPEDFLRLDVKDWSNEDPSKVYFNGKYYNPRDPAFIKLRNNNFLKHIKNLSDMYSDDVSLEESLRKVRGRSFVVLEANNDFFRPVDFHTNEDL